MHEGPNSDEVIDAAYQVVPVDGKIDEVHNTGHQREEVVPLDGKNGEVHNHGQQCKEVEMSNEQRFQRLRAGLVAREGPIYVEMLDNLVLSSWKAMNNMKKTTTTKSKQEDNG